MASTSWILEISGVPQFSFQDVTNWSAGQRDQPILPTANRGSTKFKAKERCPINLGVEDLSWHDLEACKSWDWHVTCASNGPQRDHICPYIVHTCPYIQCEVMWRQCDVERRCWQHRRPAGPTYAGFGFSLGSTVSSHVKCQSKACPKGIKKDPRISNIKVPL